MDGHIALRLASGSFGGQLVERLLGDGVQQHNGGTSSGRANVSGGSTFATIRVQLLFIWNPSPLRPHFTALFILDRYRPIACCMEVRTAIHTGCAILRTVSAHRNASADARPADEFGALDTNTLIRVLPASITENCHGERPNCTAFLVLLVLHTCEFAKWTLHRSNTHDRTCNPRTMWTYCLLHGR